MGAVDGPASPPPAGPSLWVVVGACVLVNLLPTAWMPALPSYDADTHLFMADHYMRGWFEGWEPRWYGGFWIYSYPPLVHQCLALVGRVVGLELAWPLAQLTVVAALPASLWLLARVVLDDAPAAGWAAAFTVVTAGLYLTLYTFGQLPTATACALMFAAAAFLVRWLRGGGGLDLAAWAGLAGATFATHHLTGIVGLGMLALAVVISELIVARAPRPRLGARALAAACCAALAAALVLAPFAWWLRTWQVPQAEIRHATRTNFFLHPYDWFTFFVGIWGGGLLAIVPAAWVSTRERLLVPYTLLVILWATLSLGTMTPVARWLFPGWSHWLTYERFALYGALLVLVPLAARLRTASRPAVLAALAVFTVLAFCSAVFPRSQAMMPPVVDSGVMQGMARFLEGGGRDRWLYLTIGLGESGVARLSRSTEARSLDGTYFTARRDPFLSKSGLGLIDTGQWQQEHGQRMQRLVFSRPQAFGVAWALSANPYGSELLRTTGWRLLGVIGAEGLIPTRSEDPRLFEGRVTAWAAPTLPALEPPLAPPGPDPAVLRLLWGLAPLGMLALGLVSGGIALRRTGGKQV